MKKARMFVDLGCNKMENEEFPNRPNSDLQTVLDCIAMDMDRNACSHSGSAIEWDWGNCKIECYYPPLRDYVIKLAADYRRLRGIVKQMPQEQINRYERKLYESNR